MRGGALPSALLLAALGFALSFASPRVRVWSLVALLGTLVALSPMVLPSGWLEIGFLGCWVSSVAAAAAVHLPRGPRLAGGLALSVNTGFWVHAVTSLSGVPLKLTTALLAIGILFPAAWLVGHGAAIAVKVASSWIIAIAMLSAALPFLPVTPGYLPDHLE